MHHGHLARTAQELNDLEEGEDAMTDEGVEEGEGTADWTVRAGPRNKPTSREREEHEATRAVLRFVRALPDGQRSYSSPPVTE